MKRLERIKEGVFYTKRDPFFGPFLGWLNQCDPEFIVEPCAGDGALQKFVNNKKKGLKWALYDLRPQSPEIQERNSLTDFPEGFDCCITNPPYLSGRRAGSLGIKPFDSRDLWQVFLDLALEKCKFVAMILPQAFLGKAPEYPRLSHIVLLPSDSCYCTEQPVCLALFNSEPSISQKVWQGESEIGELKSFSADPCPKVQLVENILFNDTRGQIGLYAADSRRTSLIRFVRGEEISPLVVKKSSRHITRVFIDWRDPDAIDLDQILKVCNSILSDIRRNSFDLALTPIHGSNQLGMQRRRLPYHLASRILSLAISRIRAGLVPTSEERNKV